MNRLNLEEKKILNEAVTTINQYSKAELKIMYFDNDKNTVVATLVSQNGTQDFKGFGNAVDYLSGMLAMGTILLHNKGA